MSEQSYTQTTDALVGTVLAGRYRILQKLGEGAMGAVYLGEHLKIGRHDAIKVLRDALASDREAIARFTRGARNVAAVQHPNVCTVYDYGDTQDGLPFLAMEFIPGESLKELLDREGRLPLARAASIATQVAGALQAAHDAEIVHRDLKPANIMIMRARDDSDAVRVVDFDIAKGARDGEESELTRLGFVVGTPEYMSPEQLMGERLDGRSDLYSLALVLFRMLTGTLPFRAESAQELMIQRLTVRPLSLAEALPGASFPAGLEALLQCALSRRPNDRHACAADFARELQAACASAASVAVPTIASFASARPEIPETRVSTAPVAPSGAAGPTTGAPRARPGRLAAWITAAAATVVLAAGGVYWTRAGGVPTPVPPAREPLPSTATPATSALTTGGTGAATDGSGPVSTERSPDPVAPPATPERERPRPTETPSSRVAARASEPSAGAPAAAGGISIPAAGASDVLWRQLDRLGPPYPAREVLTAVRDSAQAVWELNGAKTQDRALSAYIAGSAWYALGSASECRSWIQRALTLRPDGPGYRAMLDNCRS